MTPEKIEAKMLYDKKADIKTPFIEAPINTSESQGRFPKPTYDLGKWLFPSYGTRFNMRKDFTASKEFDSVYLELQSDSKTDFYINGTMIEAKKYPEGYYASGVCDITEHTLLGNNKMALRMYLTDEPDRFLVALRGTVVVKYKDGDKDKFDFDNGWHSSGVTDFWCGIEREAWYLEEYDEFKNDRKPHYLANHPHDLRRGHYFRRGFESNKSVESATLYASAKGLYVPYLNGKRVTQGRFIPGSMEKLTEYQVFDVTSFINDGYNVLGAETGSGWLNCYSGATLEANSPTLMMHLEIKYTDGTTEVVETDENWLCTPSPRTEDDIQFGERYDARLEIKDWCLAKNPDGIWQSAVVSDKDFAPLANHTYPAVRVQNEVKAVQMGKLADGTTYYEFKYNSTGRAKIVLKNTTPGERVIIRYCEIIENGVPYVGTYGDYYYENDTKADGITPYAVKNIDVYICKGADEEVYLPEFAFTGFRYVYISGYSGKYELDTVIKVEMNSDLKQVGDIVTSHDGIMRIWDAVKRSWRSNIFTGPIDCPTREKNFWNGDIQVFATAASWYTNTESILARWSYAGRKMHPGVYAWEDEEFIVPLTLYRFYGNKQVLEEKYPIVKALISKRSAGVASGELPQRFFTYGDHQATKKVPNDFFSHAYYCYMYKCAAKMAEILGYTEDKEKYSAEFEACRKTYNDKYYLANEKDYSPKMQGGIVIPVALGIAEEKDLPELAKKLNDYVIADGYHHTTGFMGNEFNLCILSEYGYSETAWKAITNTEYPSMLNMIDSYGGGTITENWKGYKTVCGSSMNHYSFGNISRWFFEHLGGITITAPGFETVCIKPCFIREAGDFEVTHETKTGVISSKWVYSESDEAFIWTVTVPAGTVARIELHDDAEFIGEESSVFELTNVARTFKVKK